jgi:seryl-tRNA synthetase
MLDIKIIRENIDTVRSSIQKRWLNTDLDKFLELDKKIINIKKKLDEKRALRNKVSKEIPNLPNEEKQEKISQMKQVWEDIKIMEENIRDLEEDYKILHRGIPNFLHPDIPEWKDDTENIVLKQVWKIKNYDFEVKDHHDLWEQKDFIDKKKASEVTWARFYYLKWDLVLLQYAIINFTFSVLTNEDILKQIISENNLNVSSKPFIPIVPPLMVNYTTMEKMWRLHPMDDRYCHPEDKQALIWSAEHALWPIHMWETLNEDDLPKRYFANTPAFRREAWTYWKDTRWIFRVHQFDKIEMESFTTKENWEEEQKFIVAIQEYLVKQLEIPYQLMNICTGDIWKPDYKQFDIECYFPWQKAYRETHTSDYMTDFQSYSLWIKVAKKDKTKENIAMNDATAFALWRIIAAVMENYQTAEGNIKIPKILVPFMGGKTEI